MFDLGPKQSRYALIIAALIYIAAMAGLITWLAFNGEETIQKRLEKTPSVTITLPGKEPPVPESWKQTSEKEAAEIAKDVMEADQQPNDTAVTEPAALPQTPAPDKVTTPAATSEQPVAEPAAAPKTDTTAAPDTTTPIAAAPVQAAPALTWQRFARPFDQATTKPRISIIIADLGLASAATLAAVQELPGEVTLAFSSSASDLESWIAKARAAGHEALLTVPMEPTDYPQNDPGPNTLLTGLGNKENVNRISRALARASGYVGVMPYMGDKFITVEDKLAPVLDVVHQQGLMMIDTTQGSASMIPTLSRLGKIPFVRADAIIDLAASRTAIDAQLDELEKIAQEKGHAVGIALPYPVTFEKLKAWVPTLEKKGFVLAPITALVSAATSTAPAEALADDAATVPAENTAPAAMPVPVKPAAPPAADPNRADNEIVQ